MDPSLQPFFNPQGIAIVGASHNPRKLGFTLTQNLIQSGFEGAIHLVNPKKGMLLDFPIRAAISDVPDPVDLAVLLIPAEYVAQTLRECGDRGIRAAIIASGGFREVGDEGIALEEECLQIAKRFDMRLIGPNCIGLIDTHLPLDTTFLPPPGPTPGDVAFISHSGAICAAVIDWARGQGFGLSKLISLGNQLDVTESDVLPEVAADRKTKVITMYLEGVGDGVKFVEVASEASKQKPIVALKVGRFESGQKAVASHTGALAGEEAAYDAAFARAGVLRADTSEELFDWARALAWCPPSMGRNVAVLTNAGGPGVTAVDALESSGLKIAELSKESRKLLATYLPAAASLENPVDMLAGASPNDYSKSLDILLQDPNVDSCLIILPPPPIHSAGGVARALIPIIKTSEKPVVVALMGERMIQEAIEHFRASKVPEYRFPERAASALAKLAERADWLAQQSTQRGAIIEYLSKKEVDEIRSKFDNQTAGFMDEVSALKLVKSYGISVPDFALAHDLTMAEEIAQKIGYPIVLKIQSENIVHKSDVDGIRVGINDLAELQKGYREIMQSVKENKPQAKIEGILVQKMAAKGQELIIGSKRDAQFGPLIMFGSGGVEVEGLGDVSFALAPLNSNGARSLLEKTWAGKRLRGYRNIPPADIALVEETLTRLGTLAIDFPEISEIEINPLIASAESVNAVDVRIKWKP